MNECYVEVKYQETQDLPPKTKKQTKTKTDESISRNKADNTGKIDMISSLNFHPPNGSFPQMLTPNEWGQERDT